MPRNLALPITDTYHWAVRVTPAQIAWLDREAGRVGIGRSSLIRAIINYFRQCASPAELVILGNTNPDVTSEAWPETVGRCMFPNCGNIVDRSTVWCNHHLNEMRVSGSWKILAETMGVEADKNRLQIALNHASARQREVIVSRYGLDGHPIEPVSVIATRLGVSRQSIHTTLKRGMDIMKEYL